MDSPETCIARVRARMLAGGTAVPDHKIRIQFRRSALAIRTAMLQSDQGHIYDNTRPNQPVERIIDFTGGQVSFARPDLPAWARVLYGADLR